ncbi:MAG: hypothetical protein V1701_03730 [Planctomycetota bacterium]
MNIDKNKIKVSAVQDSINPELLFEIEFLIQGGREIPLEITGSVLSEDNKKITNIHEVINSDRSLKLSSDKNNQNESLLIKLIAPLNHKILDHIQTLRTTNLKGDVVLNINLLVKVLTSNIHFYGINSIPIEKLIPSGIRELSFVCTPRERGYNTDRNLLSIPDNYSPFMEIKNTSIPSQKITIGSGDWVHDYCPIFQIGKFSVFEYLMPDYTEGSESLGEKLNKAIDTIKKMEGNIIKGEWAGAIEDSRPVMELLRNETEIKDLLTRDGYTDQAYNSFNDGIKKLFDFSSKFIHPLDINSKKLMPDTKAYKEDAYLIYALSVHIVNLISKKMQRLNKN